MRILLALTLFALCGCSARSGDSPSGERGECSAQVLERLYFGGETPSGRVSDTEWERFLRDEVTPRFPDGLTVVEANGQWRAQSGEVVREHSRIVEIVQEDSDALHDSVDEIAAEYRRRFSQEAVLELRGPMTACIR